MTRRDVAAYFRLESEELIHGLEVGLLAHGSAAFDLTELFRKAHTLKGAARVTGQEAVAELAHTLEDVLAHHRETGEALSQQAVSELLRLVDALRGLLREANDNRQPRPSAGPAPARDLERLRVDLAELDELTAELLEAEVHAAALQQRVGELQDLKRLARSVAEQAVSQAGQGTSALLRAGLDELLSSLDEHRAQLTSLSEKLSRDLRQVGERAAALRLVEVARLFPELERGTHDAAQAVGRSVSFTAVGASVRVDGHVIAALRQALLHIVCNAVAHGIEAADERVRAGKPATGRVRVEVRREGQRIRVAVHDDGRGLDREAVLRAAERRGFAGANHAERRAEDWIFEPGLSTAHQVSAIAGRGVGLDAARSAVEACKGRISVTTQPGAGCCFELDVPVSLSAIGTLCVEAAGQSLLLPLSAVRATRRIAEHDVVRSGAVASFVYEGNAIAFWSAGQLVSKGVQPEPRVAVVVRSRGRDVALGVSALHGTREVVVRSLPAAAGRGPQSLYLGAAFDVSGTPQLVLDPDALDTLRARSLAVSPAGSAERKPVLVIDDSLTTRMLEQSILEAAGYRVDLAASAEEGLAKALAHDFGVIVVDAEMPGMNGYQFTREARATSKLSALPIIMVTSLASDESRQRARDAGVSAYIVKGEFDQKRFLAKIAELLR